MKIKVRWEVEDGYAGPSRPQYTTINTEDMMEDSEWNALSEDEKKEHIESEVQQDFDNKISFCIEDYGIKNQ